MGFQLLCHLEKNEEKKKNSSTRFLMVETFQILATSDFH